MRRRSVAVGIIFMMAVALDSASAGGGGGGCGTLYDWEENDILNDDEWHSANSSAPSGGDPGGDGEWRIVQTHNNRHYAHQAWVEGYIYSPYYHHSCGSGSDCPVN